VTLASVLRGQYPFSEVSMLGKRKKPERQACCCLVSPSAVEQVVFYVFWLRWSIDFTPTMTTPPDPQNSTMEVPSTPPSVGSGHQWLAQMAKRITQPCYVRVYSCRLSKVFFIEERIGIGGCWQETTLCAKRQLACFFLCSQIHSSIGF